MVEEEKGGVLCRADMDVWTKLLETASRTETTVNTTLALCKHLHTQYGNAKLAKNPDSCYRCRGGAAQRVQGVVSGRLPFLFQQRSGRREGSCWSRAPEQRALESATNNKT